MTQNLIPETLSKKVIMTGVYYKNNHPGGISAVIQYWSKYIPNIQYYPTFKEGSALCKIWWFLSSYLRIFVRLLIDRNIKIVHVHTAADTDFLRSTMVVKLSKVFGKKVVLHSHASRFKDFYSEANKDKKNKILSVLKKADTLIVLSNSWLNWFSSIGVEEHKLFILHNITDYPQIEPYAALKKTTSLDGRPLRFLFLGEIGQRKGVFDILRALSTHMDEIKEKVQLKIGGNKNEGQLIKMISDNKLSDIVTFEGFVSGEKKNQLLNWADIFILPSFNEGLPISILEAMSYGLPIISTAVGGIPEVVDKTNGVIVKPGDADDIYNAMNFYCKSPKVIKDQSEISRERASLYLPDYVMAQLKSIYESLL